MAHPTPASRGGSLTPDDFREGAAGASAQQRRREPRVACGKSIAVFFFEGDGFAADHWRFETVELFDCSVRGLALRVPRRVAVGGRFLAKFRLNGISLLEYTVRHCGPVPTPDGHVGTVYKVGAELTGFTARPEFREVAELIAALERAAPGADRGAGATDAAR